MLQNQWQNNNAFKVIIVIIIIAIIIFIVFPPLIFILGFLYFKSWVSLEKLLKVLWIDIKNTNNSRKNNYSRNNSNAPSKIKKPVTYKKTSYDELVENRKKDKIVKSRIQPINKNSYKAKEKNNNFSKNYSPNSDNKSNKYEFNWWKSIWDDYESVLSKMDNK
jgi:hypothetical protein